MRYFLAESIMQLHYYYRYISYIYYAASSRTPLCISEQHFASYLPDTFAISTSYIIVNTNMRLKPKTSKHKQHSLIFDS